MTNLDRLKLELNNKPYLTDVLLSQLLLEQNLIASDTFSAKNDMISLKKTLLSVLSILSNDIENLMKISTEFVTRESAYQWLSVRIKDVKNEIKDLKEEERSGSADKSASAISILYYDYLEEEDDD